MLFVYKRSHTHTAVSPHAHIHNLNFTSTSLGKIFSKYTGPRETWLHNEVLFGSQPLGPKSLNITAGTLGMTDQGRNQKNSDI